MNVPKNHKCDFVPSFPIASHARSPQLKPSAALYGPNCQPHILLFVQPHRPFSPQITASFTTVRESYANA